MFSPRFGLSLIYDDINILWCLALEWLQTFPVVSRYKNYNHKIFITMKTHLFIKLCFCFSLILFASCSNEDDNDSNDPSDNIIIINVAEYPSSGEFIATLNSNFLITIIFIHLIINTIRCIFYI